MNYPKVVCLERSSEVASLLQRQFADRPWVLQSVRDRAEIHTVLPPGSRGLVIVSFEGVDESLLECIDWLKWRREMVAVIGIVADRRTPLAAVVSELGATAVLDRDGWHAELPGLVEHLMTRVAKGEVA